MTPDHVLVLAWLVLAHLVADFLLQSDGIVADKQGDGRRAWRGFVAHGAAVALCLTPFCLAFGVPGLGLLLVITAGHVLIDVWKTRATRAAERRTDAAVRRRDDDGTTPEALGPEALGPEAPGPEAPGPEALGPAWTPVPALLFALDQLFHVALIGAAWLVFLARGGPTAEWTALVDRALDGFPAADIHRASLLAAVVGSLLIVNVRAGAFFVATLVRPRGREDARPLVTTEPPPAEPPMPASWRVRLGPLEAVAVPSRSDNVAVGAVTAGVVAVGAPVAHASPIRIGATIGVLERLLIVIFVLSGAVAAIGFVVAAKTLARFKQLDDRDFAEYYLLGTLASVAVGLASALLAQAVLGGLPT